MRGNSTQRLTRAAYYSALGALTLLASGTAAAAQDQAAPPQDTASSESAPADSDAAADPQQTASAPVADEGSETDIFSKNTLYLLLDGRLVAADGHKSFAKGGFGKTRFDGTKDGDFQIRPLPVEADLVWAPRFTSWLSANVSAAWQRDQQHSFDLMEAFVTILPSRGKTISFAAKAGLYWPEISMEHSTGGAWTAVNTITPSAINAWVGEEVKVIGAEGTITASLGRHDISATGAAFGFNDTSGTLLSFRGWALHDLKATAFGHFELPPLNPFIGSLQQNKTRSLIDLDHRVGFYGRLEWRPPWPFSVNAFYYDNRGDPEVFHLTGQWGWRTRFWNFGLNADLGSGTRLLAQGMTGSTIMGFKFNDVPWVHTHFQSAYVLVTHDIGKGGITGRVEAFGTHERGSVMERNNSEEGWAATMAGRWAITNNLTGLVEFLHVRSRRGFRTNFGLPAVENQNVLQAALRFRI